MFDEEVVLVWPWSIGAIESYIEYQQEHVKPVLQSDSHRFRSSRP